MTYKYTYKCLLCKEQFNTDYPRSDDGNNICDKCKVKIEDKKVEKMDERTKGNNREGVNGVKKLSKKETEKKVKAKAKAKVKKGKSSLLMNSNPNGYNSYNKNSNPKPKNEYLVMAQNERHNLAIKLFQASRKFHRLYRSALARHDYLMSLDIRAEDTVVEDASDERLLELAENLK